VTRRISAPADVVWTLLTDVDRWAEWGPTVRDARWDDGGPMRLGARGTVITALGVHLPFVVTSFEDGRSWGWSVAGVPATDHAVLAGEAGDAGDAGDSCRARFRVPLPALPYLAVCRIALRRIEELAASVSR
jgi:hypothetical protein